MTCSFFLSRWKGRFSRLEYAVWLAIGTKIVLLATEMLHAYLSVKTVAAVSLNHFVLYQSLFTRFLRSSLCTISRVRSPIVQYNKLQPPSPPLNLFTPISRSPPYFLSKFPCSVCCLIKKLLNAAHAANPNAATHTPLKLST
jgi:hypothetical protein